MQLPVSTFYRFWCVHCTMQYGSRALLLYVAMYLADRISGRNCRYVNERCRFYAERINIHTYIVMAINHDTVPSTEYATSARHMSGNTDLACELCILANTILASGAHSATEQ
jgi:hypothetical protein